MIYIALGANQSAQYQGETLTPKQSFIKLIQILPDLGVKIIAVSGLWESPAWPDPDAQPAYNNAVLRIETDKTPLQLLSCLQKIETDFGRKLSARNAPRPLDLDILDFKGLVISSPHLTLPHPRMCARPFVLFPLQDIAPHWRDPIIGRSLSNWIARLPLKDTKALNWIGVIT